MNTGAAVGGVLAVLWVFMILIYLAIVVFSMVMFYRLVRAHERIAAAQERRADAAPRGPGA